MGLEAGVPLVFQGTIIGGPGQSVVEAVQQYVAFRLPAVPDAGRTLTEFAQLEARGWLDSGIRVTNLYRHAAASNFTPQPGAALWMRWLSGRVEDLTLAGRLASLRRSPHSSLPMRTTPIKSVTFDTGTVAGPGNLNG